MDQTDSSLNRGDSAKVTAAGVLAAGIISASASPAVTGTGNLDIAGTANLDDPAGTADLGATAQTADAAAAADLEAAFRAAFSVAADRSGAVAEARLALLDEAVLVIDHDIPFPIDRAAYADHLTFQAGVWDRVETRLLEVSTAVHGSTGVVSAYFVQRGKPVDSGFRLRAGYCTAVCTRDLQGWRAIGLHLAPLAGQIIDASPS